MNGGHEDCGQDLEVIGTLLGDERVLTRCHRDHLEPVAAQDGFSTGPVVADHCLCCGDILTRPGW